MKELRQHFEKVIQLTDDEFEYIFSHFTFKKLKKHQFLVQEGSMVTYDYFVVKGLLKAYFNTNEGKEHIIQFAMEDWWVTDYQAFFGQSAATLHVDCLEDVQLLCLSLHNRNKICAEMHKMEHFFNIKATRGYMSLQRRILSMMHNDARGQYEQLLNLYPSLFQRLPKTLIAAYLGVSRETLSRLYP